jgi:hypothetical protein
LHALAAVGGHRGAESVCDFQDSIDQTLDSRHESLVVLGRRITHQQSSDFQDCFVSGHPIVFRLFALKVRQHIPHRVAEFALREHVDRVHGNHFNWWRLCGFTVEGFGKGCDVVKGW